MAIIDELIFNRTLADVNRLKSLAAKGWQNMSEDERNEYLTTIGAYKITDINRVGTAQLYVRDIFNEFPDELYAYLENAKQGILRGLTRGEEYYTLKKPLLADAYKDVSYSYPIALEDVKTDWAIGDYPAEFTNEAEHIYDVGYYLVNVAILKAILTLPNSVPNVPTDFWSAPNYTKANAIERILYEIYLAYLSYTANKKTDIDEAQAAEIDYYDRMQKSWVYSAEAFAGEF